MSSFTTPPIVKMHDIDKWELFTSYTYYREPLYKSNGEVKKPEEYSDEEKKYRTLEKVVVPAGFITDLATIPRILWSIFPPHDKYAKAAILHDYLYENAIGSKKEADLIFLEALEVLGVTKWKRKILYWGVKYFGKGNYK